jgi:copper(I)-binding protein
MRRLLLGVVLAGLAATASAQGSAIHVTRPQIRASLGNVPTAAAYLTLHNMGPADRLVGASCACAAAVTLHTTVNQGGVARMVEEKSVALPAGGQVSFAPGGRHLMLTGLKAPLRAGAKADIVLRFEKAGAVTASFTATDTPGGGAQMRH